MEKRLKKDIMNEIRIVDNGCNILVHEEISTYNVPQDSLYPLQLSRQVLHVDPSTILTTQEMFYMVTIKGYNIKYHRIPVIEMQPPSIVSVHFPFVVGSIIRDRRDSGSEQQQQANCIHRHEWTQ